MSTIPNDGGQAFPGFEYTEGNGNFRRSANDQWWEMWSTGMTLRDYFAARFAAAMIATPNGCDVISKHAQEDGMRPTERMALVAYDLADAMLRQRAKQIPAKEAKA